MPIRTQLTVRLLAVMGAALLNLAAAQVTRVAVFPFDVSAATQAYQLGLPGAVQRALNQLPNVYAPPVGDVALVANKAVDAEADVNQTVTRLFEAGALVTGQVTLTAGSGAQATVNVEVGGQVRTVQASGADPAQLALAVAEGVAGIVAPGADAGAMARLRAAAAQTPSLPSLGPTGLSTSGLPGASVTDLAAAAELDPDSAWVLAEYAKATALAGNLESAADIAVRAAQAAPEDADVQATAGVVLRSAGRDQDAFDAFSKALQVNPVHAIALVGRASLAGLGAVDPSADLQTALAAYPRFIDAHLRLADREPDAARRLQTLRRAERYSPESVLLRGTVIDLLLDNGEAAGALSYLQQATADPLARSASLYALARLLPASHAEQALELVQAGEELYPQSAELKVAHADLLIKSDEPAAAAALLRPVHEANPANREVGAMLAVSLARSGDLAGARDVYTSQRGSGPDVDRGLAEIYLAAGRAAGALELLGPLAQAAPEDAGLQALYGTALVRMGRLDDGRAALERAIALDANNALARRSLSILEQQRQLTGAADVTFTEEAGVAFQQGLYALDVQDYDAANDAFGRSLQAQAGNPLAAFYRGYTRHLTGDHRGAIADYQTALEAFGESDIVLNNLGYAYLQTGRYDMALSHLRRAVAANDGNAQAHLNLGLVQMTLQNYAQALAEFERAVELDPDLGPTLAELIATARERAGQ
jgi:tetratricopeptide (TPR) repeat protein